MRSATPKDRAPIGVVWSNDRDDMRMIASEVERMVLADTVEGPYARVERGRPVRHRWRGCCPNDQDSERGGECQLDHHCLLEPIRSLWLKFGRRNFRSNPRLP